MSKTQSVTSVNLEKLCVYIIQHILNEMLIEMSVAHCSQQENLSSQRWREIYSRAHFYRYRIALLVNSIWRVYKRSKTAAISREVRGSNILREIIIAVFSITWTLIDAGTRRHFRSGSDAITTFSRRVAIKAFLFFGEKKKEIFLFVRNMKIRWVCARVF